MSQTIQPKTDNLLEEANNRLKYTSSLLTLQTEEIIPISSRLALPKSHFHQM